MSRESSRVSLRDNCMTRQSSVVPVPPLPALAQATCTSRRSVPRLSTANGRAKEKVHLFHRERAVQQVALQTVATQAQQ